MPTFNPTGFQYSRSLTASQPFVNGMQKFTWNQSLNGFAGDAVCNMLYDADDTGYPIELSPLVNSGTVYPVPFTFEPPNFVPPESGEVVYPAAVFPIGVISSFKYFPTSLPTGQFITSSTFAAGTSLQQNTTVEVTVVVDPNAIYSIQVNAPNGLTQVTASCVFAQIGADNYYIAELQKTGAGSSSLFAFPLGEFEGNSTYPGSRAYLTDPNASCDGTRTTTIVGLTEGIEGNGISNMDASDNPIAPIVSYPTVDAVLANQFFYAGIKTASFG